MKTAKLEMLGLEVPLDEHTNFYDLGYVGSIDNKLVELSRRYGSEVPHFEGTRAGYTYTATEDDSQNKDIYIFYKRRILPGANMVVRAHEETHALIDMGGIRLLEDGIEQEFGKRIQLTRYGYDEEFVADLGAIYALHRHKVPPPLRRILLTLYRDPFVAEHLGRMYKILKEKTN